MNKEEYEAEKEESDETPAQKKKRKREQERAIAKIKQSKDFKRRKAYKEGERDEDEDDVAFDMYSKAKALPGQMDNCEICEKRFTVTPYSKTGPEGGLLCAKCSKELVAGRKKGQKPNKQAGAKDKRRQTQSSLLDGIVRDGSKTLQELCVEVRTQQTFRRAY